MSPKERTVYPYDRPIRWPILLLLLVGVTPFGCGKKQAAISEPEDAGTRFHAGAEITEQECKEFADKLEKAVKARDRATYNRLFDLDAVLDQATSGIEVPAKARASFIQGAKAGFAQGGLSNAVFNATAQGGSYQLLRVHRVDGRPRVMFRLILPEGGVNYHDYSLARRPNGEVRGVDLYVFMSGEQVSQSFRRGYLPLAAQANAGLLDRLTVGEQSYVKHLPTIKRMTEAAQGRRFAEALKAYGELPEDLRKEKTLLLIRLAAAQHLGNDENQKALEDFRQAHPEDTCLDFMSIDYFALKKDFAKSLEALERVEKSVGGDPYLLVIRAGLLAKSNDFAAAAASATKAAEQEPTLIPAHVTLLKIAALRKDHAETLRRLQDIDKKFPGALAGLENDSDFAEFRKTPQYKQWQKSREKK